MAKYKIEKDTIFGYEPFFKQMVQVASIDHNQREIRPSQGYFPPHKYSKKTQAHAKKLGYKFNDK